jgi:hypothetical protein
MELVNKVKILYMFSGIFIMLALVALITPTTFYFVKTAEHEVSVDTFDLELNDDTIVISNFNDLNNGSEIYVINNDIDEIDFSINETFLIHTIKASKCSTCSIDLNFLLISINNKVPDLKQLVWVVDYPIRQIVDLVKDYGIKDFPIIVAHDSSFNQVLNYGYSTYDRNLIFAKKINQHEIVVHKRFKIPYNFDLLNVSLRDEFIETITNLEGDQYENKE